MRAIVIGGGYAGMATLIGLRQQLPDAELHLVDPGSHHLKLTQLHETLGNPLDRYRKPFRELGQRFGFSHHRTAVDFEPANLVSWQDDKSIPLADGPLAFDYLVIATGAKPRPIPGGPHVYAQEDFYHQEGQEIIKDFLERTGDGKGCISVVGGGATGLQFLFELHSLLRRDGQRRQLRLINRGDKLLPSLPGGFNAYIGKRLKGLGVDYLPDVAYLGQEGDEIQLQEVDGGRRYGLESHLTLVFPGATPYPHRIQANRYGRVVIGDRMLNNIFTAGDCSRFSSRGLNAPTAQAAVRKGKQIATNIKRMHVGRLPYIYSYAELGYFVSMGPMDGIGWLVFKRNILTGLSAFAIQKALEVQYDLFVDGVDMYV